MKRAMTSLTLTLCALVFPYLAQAQNNGCYTCKNNACSNGNSIGGCICSEIVGGGCYSCGICAGGRCSMWCLAPSDKNSPSKEMSIKDFLNSRATRQVLETHPWLEDSGLAAQLAKYSPEMAQLIQSEQPALKASFCTNFRRGSRFLKPDDPSTEYSWELIPRAGSDEYRLTRTADGREFRLIMSGTEWMLFSGAYSELLGKGDMAAKQQTQANP